VRFDKGVAEFHCFSDDHCDMTFGQLMGHLNQHYPPFPRTIWDWGEEDFSDFAEDVTAADEISEGTAVEPNDHDESDNRKGALCPKCNKELIGGAQDHECKTCREKAVLRPGEEHVLVGNAAGENIYVSVMHMDRVVPKPLGYGINACSGSPSTFSQANSKNENPWGLRRSPPC
jgi:hypothetical protein